MTKEEFEVELLSCGQNLLGYALNLTCDAEDAEDLVQEVYCRALEQRAKYCPTKGKLGAWVNTMLYHQFVNVYRRTMKHNPNSITESTYQVQELSVAQSVQADQLIRADQVTESLDCLSQRHREVMDMRIAGFKYEEIAEELSINIGTVKSAIFKSRERLLYKVA